MKQEIAGQFAATSGEGTETVETTEAVEAIEAEQEICGVPYSWNINDNGRRTFQYGGTIVASQEKYILIIPKQNRSNSQTKPLYDTDNK